MNVCVLFMDKSPYTTGHYLVQALEDLGHNADQVDPAHPSKTEFDDVDFYIRVGDGTGRGEHCTPSIYWETDFKFEGDNRIDNLSGYYDHVYLANAQFEYDWIPLAASLEHFRFRQEQEYFASLAGSFGGKLYGHRNEIFRKLEDEFPDENFYWEAASRTEFPNIYARSQVCLNITCVDTVNMRTFEGPIAGALLLQEAKKPDENGFHDVFNCEEEAYCWSTYEELVDLLYKVKDNPQQAREVAMRGQRRVLQEHLYRYRILDMIDIIKENHDL